MPFLRRALWIVFVVAGALLVVRVFGRPNAVVRSPINVEGLTALAGMLLLVMAAGVVRPAWQVELSTGACIGILIAAVGAAFWGSLRMPLLSDDYVHLTRVRNADAHFWMDQFTVVPYDHFFRPIAMYAYKLDSMWAGKSAVAWRSGNLLIHVINVLLVFFLGRRMGLAKWAALVAALIFGWHGSRPETVAWVAARFDLLAVMFLLASLLLLYRYVEQRATLTFLAALIAGVAALLSKESAFVWPAAASLLLWRRLSLRAQVSIYGVTAAVFLYRLQLLGGIGGYGSEAGQPTIFNFSLLRTANALLLRLWATLWFPLNWDAAPGLAVSVCMVAMLGSMAWVLWKKPAVHWRALAFVFLAALPVQHMLLIGADLEKSRVLYLPSVGFGILIACALQSVPRSAGLTAAAMVLVFQLAALQHNLAIWSRVGDLTAEVCTELGGRLNSSGKSATVVGVPNVLDGVYFLRQNLGECVEWHTGVAAERVQVVDNTSSVVAPLGSLLLRFDPELRRIVVF
ncbi:MAG: glycosyltransferase family 39 protein [Acidobacteriota bacterium]